MKTLIKNAKVISMDSAIGVLDGGDILFDGEEILEVAQEIAADDADH